MLRVVPSLKLFHKEKTTCNYMHSLQYLLQQSSTFAIILIHCLSMSLNIHNRLLTDVIESHTALSSKSCNLLTVTPIDYIHFKFKFNLLICVISDLTETDRALQTVMNSAKLFLHLVTDCKSTGIMYDQYQVYGPLPLFDLCQRRSCLAMRQRGGILS